MDINLPSYNGSDLGANYTKKGTEFVVWAPLSNQTYLNLEIKPNKFTKIEMTKEDNGVFRTFVKGNLLNRRYRYIVNNNGVITETNDPWGKGTSFNSEYSAVVDIEAVKKLGNVIPSTPCESPNDAIVYEVHIRDFTEDKHSDIQDKRHYLGMIEEGRKTLGGHPAGIDYLKFLGITHVQILPIHDYLGADDKDYSLEYNWGYNPISYFALEGSYSKAPEIPMSRLLEFKEMVNGFHKNDIRVIIDVVYNHIYDHETCFMQKLVPDYFLRFFKDGKLSQSSGCGNDLASEKPMMRKMIIESLKYLVEVYDVDGFRFDLMGINDIETINMAYEACKEIKKDIIFYGEGWDMPSALPSEKRASMNNAKKMPNIGFFNDLYRDTIKGPTFPDQLAQKGYIGGNLEKVDLIPYCLLGSVTNKPFKGKFLYAHQSVNYVECHDNNTLFDKLQASNPEEPVETILKRITLANSMVMYSFGIPFFHMGQEIGQSKFGLENSYNVKKVNNMSWALLDERFDMACYFSMIAYLRKFKLPFLRYDIEKNIDIFTVQKWGNDILCLYSDNKELIAPYNKIVIIINPTNKNQPYELDDYYRYLSSNSKGLGEIYIKRGIIPACSTQVLYL